MPSNQQHVEAVQRALVQVPGVRHSVTTAQAQAFIDHEGGWPTSSYLLDPEQNWLPATLTCDEQYGLAFPVRGTHDEIVVLGNGTWFCLTGGDTLHVPAAA